MLRACCKLILPALAVFMASCNTIDVFEKDIAIPKHEWSTAFRPEISFEITDTASLYNIYIVVRHSDAYRYNNLWINLYTRIPNDTLRKQRLDLRLATDDKGWLGSGMDDIYEHRILITNTPQQLNRKGQYTFSLENIMREEPLEHVMNVGIRVEKTKS